MPENQNRFPEAAGKLPKTFKAVNRIRGLYDALEKLMGSRELRAQGDSALAIWAAIGRLQLELEVLEETHEGRLKECEKKIAERSMDSLKLRDLPANLGKADPRIVDTAKVLFALKGNFRSGSVARLMGVSLAAMRGRFKTMRKLGLIRAVKRGEYELALEAPRLKAAHSATLCNDM